MKGPKLVHRHRFEIMRFHFLNPDDLSLSKAASAQRPILGDSGPLQWSKKAKTECPPATVIPLSYSVRPFVHQKLRLWIKWGAPRLKTDAKPSWAAFALACLWHHDATSSGLPSRRLGASFSRCPGPPAVGPRRTSPAPGLR